MLILKSILFLLIQFYFINHVKLLKISEYTSIKNRNYQVPIRVSNLIASLIIRSKFECLASCTSNYSCKSAIYKPNEAFNENCFLFNVNLNSYDDLIEENAIDFYSAHSTMGNDECHTIKCNRSAGLTCDETSKRCKCYDKSHIWLIKFKKCVPLKQGWTSYLNKYIYFISTIRANYTDAENYCAKMDSTLIVINDQNEFDHFTSLMRNISNKDQFWVGCQWTKKTSQWTWADGSITAKNSSWFDKNDITDKGTDWPCMYYETDKERLWNNFCHQSEPRFICESKYLF